MASKAKAYFRGVIGIDKKNILQRAKPKMALFVKTRQNIIAKAKMKAVASPYFKAGDFAPAYALA